MESSAEIRDGMRSELRCVRAERDRAQEACKLMGERITELEDAMRSLVAVAAANMGGLTAYTKEPYPPHHVAIINQAQRLIGGRELPT